MTAINMGLLKSQNDVLHRLISSHLNIGQAFGEVEIDLAADLPVDLTMRLLKWLERQPKPAPPAPVVEEQISMEDILREQQADADTRAARAELDRLVAEEFLEPTDRNLSLIRHHVNTYSSGYFSATTVNQAYQALGPQGSNRLSFTEPPSAPPEPPAPPAEVLTKLKDGSTQLPLDASERQMKAATVAQLYDLNARLREASKQQFRDNSARYVGSFGSKF